MGVVYGKHERLQLAWSGFESLRPYGTPPCGANVQVNDNSTALSISREAPSSRHLGIDPEVSGRALQALPTRFDSGHLHSRDVA